MIDEFSKDLEGTLEYLEKSADDRWEVHEEEKRQIAEIKKHKKK